MSDSLRGQLLISSERLGDPNFVRTVVLLISHDQDGAIGLILNRPLPIPLSSIPRPNPDSSKPREGFIHHGGPCGSGLLALFDDQAALPGTQVLPGVHCSPDAILIQHLLTHPDSNARFFSGYSGWSAGQLESELEERAWLLLPARPEHVFAEPATLWDLTRTELVLGQRVPPRLIPPDPTVN